MLFHKLRLESNKDLCRLIKCNNNNNKNFRNLNKKISYFKEELYFNSKQNKDLNHLYKIKHRALKRMIILCNFNKLNNIKQIIKVL